MQACGRASVDKIEFKRGVISVRAWSVKRAGVEWQSYKARLLYVENLIGDRHVTFHSRFNHTLSQFYAFLLIVVIHQWLIVI